MFVSCNHLNNNENLMPVAAEYQTVREVLRDITVSKGKNYCYSHYITFV